MFVRLILLAILFFLGYTLYHAFRRSLPSSDKPEPPARRTPEGEKMVEDALDGTFFPISQAVTITKDGKTLYFASEQNRDTYLKDKKT